MTTSRAPAFPLACPLCEGPLDTHPATRRCPRGHAFDVAREGYLNLLPPQHARRGIAGDSTEMLQARRRFLAAGHYRPLADALLALAAPVSARPEHPLRVLEVGCGEGYFVGTLADALGARVCCAGSDLSKAAVRMAARAHPAVTFFVADTHRRLPVPDARVHLLLDVLAPRNPAEFARVLAPGGIAAIVIPTDAHLASLRATLGLIGVQPQKAELVEAALANDFTLVQRTPVTFPLALDAAAVRDLVLMGPNRWHAAADAVRDAAFDSMFAGAPVLHTEASFTLLAFRREAHAAC